MPATLVYLILAVVLNAYLAVVFKIFARFGVEDFQAIVFNYLTCVVTGSVFLGGLPIGAQSLHQPWLPWAVGMGLSFISLFSLTAYCIQQSGIAATSVANKLSLVIPVAFAVWLYHEPLPWQKIAGIIIALPAVWLSTKSAEEQEHKKRRAWLLPLLLFVGSGLLDTTVNHITQTFFAKPDAATQHAQASYLVHSFAAAGTIGLLFLLTQYAIGKRRFAWRHLIAGIVLGIPNFFSIYFLIKLLNSGFMDTSAALPATNIGVVLLAASCAMTFFGEKTSWQRIAGLALSVASILFLCFSGTK